MSKLPPLLPSTVTATAFATTLSRYTATIARKSGGYASAARNLDELDVWRCEELPAIVRERTDEKEGEDGSSHHITAEELVDLTYCKLKRGKFRPLAGLVASNTDSKVIKASRAAFSLISDNTERESVLAALKAVSSPLSGVGPATASYILAVYHPSDIPVFSDEGYRWVLYEAPAVAKGGKGWEREMKYNAKEYGAYLEGAQKVAERLGVTQRDVERVGYVLGREAEEERVLAGGAGAKRKAAAAAKKGGKKARKAELDTPAEGEEGEDQPTRPGRVLRNRTVAKT
ncbi:hypothetical protein EDC01DRAFT_646944 [Geopyxis carbonaria]|nr:hypothetical protein EDC01DRAFT_646944 [Geopyxis carbonaria]